VPNGEPAAEPAPWAQATSPPGAASRRSRFRDRTLTSGLWPLAALLGIAVSIHACASVGTGHTGLTTQRAVAQGDVGRGQAGSDRLVGIALAAGVSSAKVSGTGEWHLYASGGDQLVVRGRGRGVWTITRRGTRLHLASSDGLATTRDGPLIARPAVSDALVTWNGKPYRGSLLIWATSEGLLVVNRLAVEDYIRGVVALELGAVTTVERAALQAQAVAARSYTYTRLNDPDIPPSGRRYDLVATVTDQVYGGAGAETELGNEAVASTVGEVITYGGRVVNAPYHAACGGTTAEPTEVWRESSLPYLQRVSDQIPGTDHYYCEGSSSFRWSRTFSGAELSTALDRYLRQYAVPTTRVTGGSGAVGASAETPRPRGTRPLGVIRAVAIDSLTPSGRVAWLAVTTDRATYHVRGNDIRFVLRAPHGEILNSTYFLIDNEPVRDGRVASLTLLGRGNGHGVGMCQWGAIGRARAGQDYRTILQTYYPGTILAHAD
jgi:stage II sporulation protein D